jgi:hypothetical protein
MLLFYLGLAFFLYGKIPSLSILLDCDGCYVRSVMLGENVCCCHRLTDGGKVVSTTHRPRSTLVLISVRR